MNYYNWPEALERRQRVMRALYESKSAAVYAGDAWMVRYLAGAIAHQRERVDYAEKKVRYSERCFTPGAAPFATPQNARDNRATTGAENGR